MFISYVMTSLFPASSCRLRPWVIGDFGETAVVGESVRTPNFGQEVLGALCFTAERVDLGETIYAIIASSSDDAFSVTDRVVQNAGGCI
ncbi:hypothetical protein L6452_28567 [Arctium lappa]|uniref:Uncharacterized protein n=1 Tax=Arctium lappa TaxID=4217 RepID=A0ACB8ZYT6_ARCLA|nr:hypothetical protein L6452_28567 [Arctium lappa]